MQTNAPQTDRVEEGFAARRAGHHDDAQRLIARKRGHPRIVWLLRERCRDRRESTSISVKFK